MYILSMLQIMENIAFVNYVRSLILQLGCVPGALLSENYGMTYSAEKLGAPITDEGLVSLDSSRSYKRTNSTSLLGERPNQQSNSSQLSELVAQSLDSLSRHGRHNTQATKSTFSSPIQAQVSGKFHDDQSDKVYPLMKQNHHFGCQLDNGDVRAAVIPANPDAWLQQQATLYNSGSEFSYQSYTGHSSADFSSLKLIQQQTVTGVGVQDPVTQSVNPSNRSSFTGSHLKNQGGLTEGSPGIPTLEASELQGGTKTYVNPAVLLSSQASLPKSADKNIYCNSERGLQNANLSKEEEASLSSVVDQLTTSNMLSGCCNRGFNSSDIKHMQTSSVSVQQGMDTDFYQAPDNPFPHLDGHMSLSEQMPGIVHNCQTHQLQEPVSSSSYSEFEDKCLHPSSGEDLFDILGVDFKNRLLSGTWSNLSSDGQNLGKGNLTALNVPDSSFDLFSVSQEVSDSATFSSLGKEHLLDAVVSRVHTATKQMSDDNMSSKTTLTKISSSSIPSSSPSFGRPSTSNSLQGECFVLPKSLSKAENVGSGSFQSAFSKDDAGSCSQTTSTHNSQISSWVDQANSVKSAGNLPTAYSKRNNETAKPNRKRLKPGENPRPRPKDRQMIQDRVKELREIVPNGAKVITVYLLLITSLHKIDNYLLMEQSNFTLLVIVTSLHKVDNYILIQLFMMLQCSIDALLERTIKHMLFLQSVTKHADKLKQTGEPKVDIFYFLSFILLSTKSLC